MTWDNQVPFTGTGRPLVYVDAYVERQETVEWRKNIIFKATMRLTGMTRGRSAARFIWTRADTNIEYNMFMTDMVKLIQNGGKIEDGLAIGSWTFTKRGRNYGLTVALPRD